MTSNRAARPLALVVRHAGRAATVALAMAVPRAAWAHPGHLVGPGTAWHHWSHNPLEVLLVLLPALWYAAGVRVLWQQAGRGRGVSISQAVAFACGVSTLAVALLTPLDAVAEALFSVHMVQHLLLMLVAAPLLVCGAPFVPALMVLPRSRRVALGRWWMRRRGFRRTLHQVANPAAVFLLQMVALWFWHFPAPYQAALVSPGVHALEHLCFFGTALVFWWTVAPPAGAPRAGEGTGILLVGGTLMQSGVLGALLMLARAPWYPAHAEGTRAWGTTLLQDQQLAGLLMWVPASAVYMAATGWIFLRWMHRDERLADAGAQGLAAPLEEASP